MVAVLAYIVILMAILYLVLHYSGVFDEIAAMINRMGQGRGRSARRTESEGDNEDLTQRLQVFEDFFGQSEKDDTESD